jgi:hypothetical protein
VPPKSTRFPVESENAAPQQGESALRALQTTGGKPDALQWRSFLASQTSEFSSEAAAATMLGALCESARDSGAVSGAMLAR